MKNFGANGIKTLKTLHLVFVMLWTVGVVVMAVLLMMNAQSGDELFMKYAAVRFVDDLIVIPSATITVVIGILYGIKTNWGFFKHRWLTVKWIVGVVVIIIGTFYLSPMLDANLEMANEARSAALGDSSLLSRENMIIYSGSASSLALLFLIVISVFKPWKKKKKA